MRCVPMQKKWQRNQKFFRTPCAPQRTRTGACPPATLPEYCGAPLARAASGLAGRGSTPSRPPPSSSCNATRPGGSARVPGFLQNNELSTCAGTVTKQTVLDKTRDIQAFQAKQCRSVGNVIMASTSEEDMSGWAQRLRSGPSHELCRPLPRFMSARQLAAFPFGGSHDGAR